jgi:hypothetical protein
VNDRKPPRFPYVAALLCAACLGAAAWTWMRYSWAWDVVPTELAQIADADEPAWHGYYLRVRGIADMHYSAGRLTGIIVRDAVDERFYVIVRLPIGATPPIREAAAFSGRLSETPRSVLRTYLRAVRRDKGSVHESVEDVPHTLVVQNRFTGASIAGLVVGAMGVFVFTVALRHWLGERRAAREVA